MKVRYCESRIVGVTVLHQQYRCDFAVFVEVGDSGAIVPAFAGCCITQKMHHVAEGVFAHLTQSHLINSPPGDTLHAHKGDALTFLALTFNSIAPHQFATRRYSTRTQGVHSHPSATFNSIAPHNSPRGLYTHTSARTFLPPVMLPI